MPSFEGNLLTQRHEIWSQETRDFRLSYGEDPESLSHLGLNRYWVVTDRQTDRITIASMRLALRAVARKILKLSKRLESKFLDTLLTTQSSDAV